MDLRTSHWKFDSNVTDVFDEHVRQSVPLYTEMHRLVADISCWFVRDSTKVFDVGTSTGEALANIRALHKGGRSIDFIGIDCSDSMVRKARERFADDPYVQIWNEDIANGKMQIRNASFITSILTMQFIDPAKRQNVVQKIYDGLNEGGGFVIVEKIIGTTPRFDQMYVELYHEMKLANGLTLEHVQNKMRSLRGVQRPNTIDENRQMLQQAGFKDIDIFFKWNNFTGFIATK